MKLLDVRSAVSQSNNRKLVVNQEHGVLPRVIHHTSDLRGWQRSTQLYPGYSYPAILLVASQVLVEKEVRNAEVGGNLISNKVIISIKIGV